jgi:hypothetical protein
MINTTATIACLILLAVLVPADATAQQHSSTQGHDGRRDRQTERSMHEGRLNDYDRMMERARTRFRTHRDISDRQPEPDPADEDGSPSSGRHPPDGPAPAVGESVDKGETGFMAHGADIEADRSTVGVQYDPQRGAEAGGAATAEPETDQGEHTSD